MKRLGYKKSRNGCRRCKERRVKCDERRPCKACARHSLPCSLEVLPPRGASSDSPAAQSKAQTQVCTPSLSTPSPGESSDNVYSTTIAEPFPYSVFISPWGPAQSSPQPPPDPFLYFTKLFTACETESASSWTSEVELMHHYTAVTYSTLSHCPAVQRILQYDLPREALSHPFLMHQILAFSGYHMAYLRPNYRRLYLMQASQHQNRTIDGMREALSRDITSSNCHAIYATSIFIMVCAFAVYPSNEKYNELFSPVDNLPNIFTLAKGMGLILHAHRDGLLNGPLKLLFHAHLDGPAIETPCQPLLCRVPELIAQIEENGLLEEPTKQCMKDAAYALSNCLHRVTMVNNEKTTSELRAVFLWPLMLSNEFVDFIRQQHPAALAILAHYSVILHAAELDVWFLKGWAKALTESVSDSLANTPWSPLVEWVVNFLATTMMQNQHNDGYIEGFTLSFHRCSDEGSYHGSY
ncbi:hypothetical protein F4810DRAFT_689815 [Camillea tinctor]|nr:hypothetical protein F4810DRAFT_689815 [Camillea tinctor]